MLNFFFPPDLISLFSAVSMKLNNNNNVQRNIPSQNWLLSFSIFISFQSVFFEEIRKKNKTKQEKNKIFIKINQMQREREMK